MSFDAFDTIRVVVIGDMILDCYVSGPVERISPEAPVPVVRARLETVSPGGAANVVRNLASLNVSVMAVGVTGEDDARSELIEAMMEHRAVVNIDGLVADPGRPTTRKLRVLADRQQIVRVDFESDQPISSAVEAQLHQRISTAIAECDMVILSDYNKGVLTDAVISAAIMEARQREIPVIVDPKRQDWKAYRGATILTPNRSELAAATGLPCSSDAEVVRAGEKARELTGADILVTRSEMGMSYLSADAPPIHLATIARKVFDVTGAGDTVIAVLAAALAARFPTDVAMKLANQAAGLVIGRVGTSAVTRDELAGALQHVAARLDRLDGKIVTLQEAVALRAEWATQGLSVGIANGCFDLIHPGHVSLIAQGAASCDRLIMALNSDASVRRLKGPTRPLQDERSRAAVIGAMRGVAAVIIFDQDTPLELITALKPDVLIKGADYTEAQVVGGDIVRANGGRVVLAQLMPGHSTTRLAKAGAAISS